MLKNISYDLQKTKKNTIVMAAGGGLAGALAYLGPNRKEDTFPLSAPVFRER